MTFSHDLKSKVLQANLDLVNNGLVIYTWGNVSAIDRKKNIVVIKPSGVNYQQMREDQMVVVDLDGQVIEGDLKPSVDLPTHLAIYKAFPNIQSIAHTHSTYATAFAQANREIVAYGTTHADYFHDNIPCTRPLTKTEVENDYEFHTGKVIVETFKNKDISKIPACLVSGHGLFTWGKDANEAVYHATVAERCAKMAFITELLNHNIERIDQYVLDKHYQRKHGRKATYGQKGQL